MADDKIKIEIDVETRSAVAELAKVAKATDSVEKHVEKLTLAQRAWAAANADIGKATEGWRVAAASVATAGAAFAGLAAASVAVMASAERQDAAIRRLGSAYDAVSAATNGAVSAQQALTLQGQIQAAGVQVNAQQLGLLSRAAREYALATGNDASQAVEKLTNAIVNNSEDALSELNLSQARATTSTQTLANMTRELEARFRGVAPAARTLNEDLEKLPQVMSSIGNSAAQAAAGGLRSFIDMLHGAGTAAAIWRDIVNRQDDQRNVAGQRQTDARNAARQTARERAVASLRSRNLTIDAGQLGGLQGMSEAELNRVAELADTARFGNAVINQAHVDAGIRGILSGRETARHAAARQAGTTAAPTSSRTEDELRKDNIAKQMENAVTGVSHAFERVSKRIELAGVGDALDQAATRAKQFAAYLGRLQDFGQFDPDRMTVPNIANLNAMAIGVVGGDHALRNRFQSIANALGLASPSDADNADLFGSIAGAQEGGGPMAREERARRSRIARRNQGTRRMAREQSLGGRVASSLGFGTDAEGRISPFDGMQAGAELLTGTVNSLTSGLTSLFDTLVSGSADAGTAFQAFASGLLTELGKMAVNKGLFYTFEGIAALFSAPPAAPAYFAAGAGLLALGAGLGIAGAATRPQAPGAGADVSTARGLAPRSSSSAASSRDLAPVTVVMSSLVPAGPNDARRVRSGLDDARRRGFGGNNAPRRVEH